VFDLILEFPDFRRLWRNIWNSWPAYWGKRQAVLNTMMKLPLPSEPSNLLA